MGIYVNPGNTAFKEALNSMIYVDKSGLISYTNSVLNTKQKNLCVSRPRRFGKSMAADMLVAYYSKGCDSEELFTGLKISEESSCKRHMNSVFWKQSRIWTISLIKLKAESLQSCRKNFRNAVISILRKD